MNIFIDVLFYMSMASMVYTLGVIVRQLFKKQV